MQTGRVEGVAPSVTLRPNSYEIDLSAVSDNVAILRQLVGDRAKIFAALKGNGYGFGVVEVAGAAVAAGVDGLALVDPADAVAIRAAGIDSEILLYPGAMVDLDLIEIAQASRLTLTITDTLAARTVAALVADRLRVFVKVDVGMERLGAPLGEAGALVELVRTIPWLELAGIYTHLHAAEPARAYLGWQIERFNRVVSEARRAGDVPLAMAASSPALSVLGGPALDAVDSGHLLYGMRVPLESARPFSFRRAFVAVKSRIVQCKHVARTEFLEQAPFPVRPRMRIAILPIGRADGLRSFTCGQVLVRGSRADIVGKLSLEHCRIDVTDVPDAAVGDEVVIVGEQAGSTITLEEVCASTGQDEVGVSTSISRSIRRIYA
jgi:alanine racemase